jgi:hypothetical protein
MVDYLRSLAAMSHVDRRSAVDALCTTWQSSPGDGQAINYYLHDLLDVDRGAGSPSHEQVTRAVMKACTSSRTDPEQFVASMAEELDMSAGDLEAKVVATCSRYRARQVRDKASGYQGNADLDPFVRGIASDAGVDLLALRSAVDAICPI